MSDKLPKAIEQLQLDHRNMRRLLAVLREEMVACRSSGRAPDFDLLDEVLHYARHYPDLLHHRKEDMIYAQLMKRDPLAKSRIGDLLQEHARLAELTQVLAAAITKIVQDSAMPRQGLEDLLETYLAANTGHMETEERVFFPAASAALLPEDWTEIDRTIAAGQDPLFGGRIAKEYRNLYDRIMRAAV